MSSSPKTFRRTTKWYADRRARFKFAVGSGAENLSDWAKAHGCTHTHLNYVLRSLRISDRLDALIYKEILRADGAAIAERFKPRPPALPVG